MIGNYLIFLSLYSLIINRHSLLLIIVYLEIGLLGGIYLLGGESLYIDDIQGIIFIIVMLVLAASESAIGLALIVKYFKNKNTLSVLNLSTLKNTRVFISI